jgi:hypothetical protein
MTEPQEQKERTSKLADTAGDTKKVQQGENAEKSRTILELGNTSDSLTTIVKPEQI